MSNNDDKVLIDVETDHITQTKVGKSNFKSENEVNTQRLPILPVNSNNISTPVSGKVDEVNFFDLLCSKDACVTLYNLFADWLNNKTMYVASGTKTPVSVITDAFMLLMKSTVITSGIITSTIATITGAFAALWAQFCALFSNGGIVGVILGIIIALLGIACIGAIVTMIVYGFLEKGFAIGWKIHHIFSWEWFCGELN